MVFDSLRQVSHVHVRLSQISLRQSYRKTASRWRKELDDAHKKSIKIHSLALSVFGELPGRFPHRLSCSLSDQDI
jgi:hypothetical protein